MSHNRELDPPRRCSIPNQVRHIGYSRSHRVVPPLRLIPPDPTLLFFRVPIWNHVLEINSMLKP